ncbi:MAG: hypothetical protein IT168_11490 [Bryobacterales bacterium]|nr:hypothetical protein [Bryobacterales bacterium]
MARRACILVPALLFAALLQAQVLPQGESKPALAAPYFPDRLHEFVWRNWDAIPPAQLAKVVGAAPADITAIARSMGLPPVPVVSPLMRVRGYGTLLRRNWHLLPYEQLTQLLDITSERLAFLLHEDDFLWVKLGRLKPQVEQLRYTPPSKPARRRAAEIRKIVKQEFTDLTHRGEPRFDFVRQLSTLQPNPPPAEALESSPLRFVYSYLALYGDPLSNPEQNPYPDGLLQRLSAVGVNGVWLHVVLRDLAPGGTLFPEFGQDSARRLANLRSFVERAARYGIGVYLYVNEPRAMPHAFFQSRPDLAGVREEQLTAMCTSDAQVRKWMSDAFSHIFTAVPNLAGVYAITASENLTNCASHNKWTQCDRCKHRTDSDIIAEVVATIEAGVHRARPDARVIVSDWGWKGHGDAREIISRLSPSVWLMSVSEWSMPIERGGIKTTVGEYAISAVGPGPRAERHWTAARAAGVKTAAEVQFNNTCEIASIPYLPVMDLVAEHMRNLAPKRLDGMLIGWTMGGHPSPNFELARALTSASPPSPTAALDAIARERYGPAGAPHVRTAWTQMSNAYREYPFHVSVVYTSPVQTGPANPLYLQKTGYSATMWGIPYDDLDRWRGPYPGDVLAAQFKKIATAWNRAMPELRTAVDLAPAVRKGDVQADLRYARAAAIKFQSVANQAKFVIARDAFTTAKSDPQRRQLRSQMEALINSEIALARELYALTLEDSRIGFEPSCHYFYLPLDLVEKVINCRWLLSQLE